MEYCTEILHQIMYKHVTTNGIVMYIFVSLERSKGGHKYMLVMTNHFTRYAQAFSTRNQLAKTTAEILFENFVVHFGFPARIHSEGSFKRSK